MNINQFPKRNYTDHQTPIEYLERLSKHLGGPNIYMKRDDLLGLTAGGNKTRKLEYLMADALQQGADTVITCGAVQSNHCRLTLSAAIKEGLKCVLVLEERVPNSYNPEASGNNFLYKLLGVDDIIVVPGGSDMQGEMEKVADSLRQKGNKPYIIPGGGSNEIGSTGYVSCALEILEQLEEMNLSIDYMVAASGSGGTHSGLLTGLHGANANIPVLGISVNKKKQEQEQKIYNHTLKTAKHVGANVDFPREKVIVLDDYVGPGYSLETEGMREAVQLAARKEGILLDPVYTGKTMAGLIDLVRKDYFEKNDNVLFVHTGGAPALYAYTDSF
ncbi:D-cysteine desulfhydrase [Oceanobacillus halophilus]|uniref:D-cysteine desulfhydrase n=1 Tax=Oceanobacillus halophilus TaxID=930130 RepID=A0A494ZV41_9BACI|nr:D-cysteine desulfhydrase [Oceanobacillus halophilus]RKQ30277.1 D-cysteine desulfhydrase [Oceanobacillus halophilus]